MTEDPPAQHMVLAVSTVIFSLRPHPDTGELTLWLPLVRRIREPFHRRWALPGGPLQDSQDLGEAARTAMRQTTGLQPRHLEQLYAFGDVDRSPNVPERVVSIVYWALVRRDEDAHAVDAENVAWHPVEEVPGPLAFDHDLIVRYAVDRLRAKVAYSPIAHAFLPEEFPLAELRRVYEAVLNRALDPSNFRRQILSQGTVEDTGRRMTGTAHRPPRLYRSAPHSSRYTLTIEENP
ncbi:NUDIX hydrolase [Nesterenkonia ebinurensis]|uniref:NUDIX hydrolase n=1 Tax=Nesterenkonia ebinurensis TaxID=2608252 RepID=UPI00123CEC54|nr:NUDIX domain-containing protein [Nesterenkonia ebinurensis]